MTTPSQDEQIDKILDSQFTWFVPPNDPGKWDSYNKRREIAKAALIALKTEWSKAARQEADNRIVDNVYQELRHIVEGDEDSVVYSLEAIGKRASKRLAELKSSKGEKK